ncbi:MAG: hypothetical protein LBV12_07115 [Puniceicoccales bacterium]|jgi:hypothetical protein|nr:hypothetical protein [Puniceicoccales bacterium]
MLPVFADLPSPDPSHFWQWCLSAAALLATVYTCVCLWQKLFPKASPPLNEKFVSRKEYERLSNKVEEVDDKIDARFREAAIAASASRDKLYTQVNLQREHIAALKNAAEETSKRLYLMDQKLDRVLISYRPQP